CVPSSSAFSLFIHAPATTGTCTLSLHDALPIWRLRQLGRGRVGPPDSVLPVPSSGAVRIMAGPDAHGAQSAEQSITVDSLHSPPNRAGTAGARQGDPRPVHRPIPGGGRHDQPATPPPTRRLSFPAPTAGGTHLPPGT